MKDIKKNKSKRLFIGIPVSTEIKTELSKFQMSQLYDPIIRYTATENLHVTLLFIGDTLTKGSLKNNFRFSCISFAHI